MKTGSKHTRRRSRRSATSRRPLTHRVSAAHREPRSSAHNGDTEGRILDAAHVVFTRHGTAGARMQDIAKEAGVNQALLHYYFRTKERLSEAAFRRAAGQLLPRVIQVLAGPAELDEKVRRIVEIELDVLSRAPYLPGYLISELHHHPERAGQLIAALTGMTPDAVRPKLFSRLRRQLADAARERRIRPIAPE